MNIVWILLFPIALVVYWVIDVNIECKKSKNKLEKELSNHI
jgi:hypothetical protein